MGRDGKRSYGQYCVRRYPYLAHRLSWAIHMGNIPNKMMVLHKRECGIKTCVNPDHLYLGTVRDNIQDYIATRKDKNPTAPKDCQKKAIILYERVRSYIKVAKMLGIARSAVKEIVHLHKGTCAKCTNPREPGIRLCGVHRIRANRRSVAYRMRKYYEIMEAK